MLTWLTLLWIRLDGVRARLVPRDARGNNSIEMAIIVGVVIVVATLIAIAIRGAIDSRIGDIK